MTKANESPGFRQNQALSELLTCLSNALENVKRPELTHSEPPALFIVGPPRTGSTYCLQWLAATNAFCYPTNFISRFWSAPFIGAMIQEMMTNSRLQYRQEFSDINPRPNAIYSEYGKTSGMLAPHEFWYFWRHHFPQNQDIGIDLSKANANHYRCFQEELAHFMSVTARPIAMKGKIINHQLEPFAISYPKALFLYIDRDPVDIEYSLLRARKSICGNETFWWSFKTPRYSEIAQLEPVEQVAAQIQEIRHDVEASLSRIHPNRSIKLTYTDLCQDPEISFHKVSDLYAEHGFTLKGTNTMPSKKPRSHTLPPTLRDKIISALKKFSK